jgi:hypothetical protein
MDHERDEIEHRRALRGALFGAVVIIGTLIVAIWQSGSVALN